MAVLFIIYLSIYLRCTEENLLEVEHRMAFEKVCEVLKRWRKEEDGVSQKPLHFLAISLSGWLCIFGEWGY